MVVVVDSASVMAPMEAMKAAAKAKTKGILAKSLADENELKASQVSILHDSPAAIGTKETKSTGK